MVFAFVCGAAMSLGACRKGSTGHSDATATSDAPDAGDACIAVDVPVLQDTGVDRGADSGPGDGGPGCDPSSGQVNGGLCVTEFDCSCPRACLMLRALPATGSCWKRCDPAENESPDGRNPACLDSEACVSDDAGTSACLPAGTLVGTFGDIPVYTPPSEPQTSAELGTAALTLTVGSIGTMTFESGYGTSVTEDGKTLYRLMLFPGAGANADLSKPLTIDIRADGRYSAGSSYNLETEPPEASVRYQETTLGSGGARTREVLRAFVRSGTLALTAAGQGDRAPAAGTLGGASAVQFEAEVCGETSAPCQP
jgi:hypothetical protein